MIPPPRPSPSTISLLAAKTGEQIAALRHRANRNSASVEGEEDRNEIDIPDDDSDVEIEKQTCCRRFWGFHWLKVAMKALFPNCIPVLQIIVYFGVCAGLTIRHLSSEDIPPTREYLVYITFTGCIILAWLLLRLVWIVGISHWILPENRFVVAMNAVLDPSLVYLLSSITVSLCWVYVPVSNVFDGFMRISVLNDEKDDLKVLFKVNLLMVLWSARVGSILHSLLIYFNSSFN